MSSGGKWVAVEQPSPESGEVGAGGTLSPKSRPMGRKENIEACGAQNGELLFLSQAATPILRTEIELLPL